MQNLRLCLLDRDLPSMKYINDWAPKNCIKKQKFFSYLSGLDKFITLSIGSQWHFLLRLRPRAGNEAAGNGS